MDTIEEVPEELLFKLLSFLDKASLTRVRELNHFWKRLASDELLWKYLCTEQAEKHKKLFTFSLDQARLSHGSWMTLFARRECFTTRARCTQCFVYVIDRSAMNTVAPLELFCCKRCNFAATTSAATAQRNYLLTPSEISALPHARTFMTEYLIRDVERLSLQKWGSKERLDTLVASKRQQKKERQEERKADGESRKRKVAQLLEDEKLASMKLPRAVQEMVKKYVRFGEEGRWAQYTFDEVSARLHRVRLVTSLCEIFSKELQNPVLRGLFWRQVDVIDTKQPLEELQKQFKLLFLARVKVREARVALMQHRCLNECNLKLEFDADQQLINAASLPYSARAAIEGFVSSEEAADIRIALTDITDALARARRLSVEKKAFHDQLAAAGLSLDDEDVPAVLSRVANCQLGSSNPDRYHLDPAHMPRVLEALAAVRERRAELLKSAAEAGVPFDFVIGTWDGHEYVHYGRGHLAQVVADAASLFRRSEWMAQFNSHFDAKHWDYRRAAELWLRLCDADELENETILQPAEAARVVKHLLEVSPYSLQPGVLTRSIEVVLAVSTLYAGDGVRSAEDVYVKMHKVFDDPLRIGLLPNVRTVARAMAAARGYNAATRRIDIGLLAPKEQMELALQPIVLPAVQPKQHKAALAMEE